MPIFDYQCEKCEFETTEVVRMNEEIEVKCPKCQTIMTKKPPTKVSFKLRGSGFHCNDYGKTGPKRK